jgi:hypothetical protein
MEELLRAFRAKYAPLSLLSPTRRSRVARLLLYHILIYFCLRSFGLVLQRRGVFRCTCSSCNQNPLSFSLFPSYAHNVSYFSRSLLFRFSALHAGFFSRCHGTLQCNFHRVSADKHRYRRDGFDLDLTYVTDRVIGVSLFAFCCLQAFCSYDHLGA